MDKEVFSIITDYTNKPTHSYDSKGTLIWAHNYDVYGAVLESIGSKDFIPFRQSGQYEDMELEGLYYNRFRYYDCYTGNYISQDPIGIDGINPTPYGYVFDSNTEIDPYGLSCTKALRKNMNRANRMLAKQSGFMMGKWKKFKGSAAHQIVAGDHMNPDAIRARQVLARNDIDINNEINGIYLKHIDPNSIQPGAYHRVIHTDKYFKNVADRLEAAELLGGRDGVMDELGNIANDLLFNNKLW